MPAYKPNRPLHLYPASFFTAFSVVQYGVLGTAYETFLGEVPCGEHRAMRQRISSFKASMRRYPAHPLHDIIPRTRTRLRFVPAGNGMDKAYLSVELYTRPGELLDKALASVAE